MTKLTEFTLIFALIFFVESTVFATSPDAPSISPVRSTLKKSATVNFLNSIGEDETSSSDEEVDKELQALPQRPHSARTLPSSHRASRSITLSRGANSSAISASNSTSELRAISVVPEEVRTLQALKEKYSTPDEHEILSRLDGKNMGDFLEEYFLEAKSLLSLFVSGLPPGVEKLGLQDAVNLVLQFARNRETESSRFPNQIWFNGRTVYVISIDEIVLPLPLGLLSEGTLKEAIDSLSITRSSDGVFSLAPCVVLRAKASKRPTRAIEKVNFRSIQEELPVIQLIADYLRENPDIQNLSPCRVFKLPFGDYILVQEKFVSSLDIHPYFSDRKQLRSLLSSLIQTSVGLHVLHGLGLVHGDVKPQNVLVNGERAVLSDFGLTYSPTRRWSEARVPYKIQLRTTAGYEAPEMADDYAYTEMKDINDEKELQLLQARDTFSFGVIILNSIPDFKNYSFHSACKDFWVEPKPNQVVPAGIKINPLADARYTYTYGVSWGAYGECIQDKVAEIRKTLEGRFVPNIPSFESIAYGALDPQPATRSSIAQVVSGLIEFLNYLD